MRKLIGTITKEYGTKVAILAPVDEIDDKIKAEKREHCKKIAEKFNIKH